MYSQALNMHVKSSVIEMKPGLYQVTVSLPVKQTQECSVKATFKLKNSMYEAWLSMKPLDVVKAYEKLFDVCVYLKIGEPCKLRNLHKRKFNSAESSSEEEPHTDTAMERAFEVVGDEDHSPYVYVAHRKSPDDIQMVTLRKSVFCGIMQTPWFTIRIHQSGAFEQCAHQTSLEFVIDNRPNSCNEPSLSTQLAKPFYEQKNCNVEFQLKDGAKIGAHTLILMIASPVFASMLETVHIGTQCGKIIADEFDMETFKLFLTYLYTGMIPQMEDVRMIEELIKVADTYKVESLKEDCVEALKDSWYMEKMNGLEVQLIN